MKKRNVFLPFYFIMAVVIFTFLSCAKEELVPAVAAHSKTQLNAKSGIQAIPATNDLEKHLTLSQGEVINFESIDTGESPEWQVAIKTYNCINRGKRLLVYNPNDPNLDFYNFDRFTVYWYKDGNLIESGTNKLACVCKGYFVVEVVDKLTHKRIGRARIVGTACYADEVATNKPKYD